MNNVLLSTILILSAVILSNLAIYGIRKRTIPGALSFSILMFAMVIHSVGYAFELICENIDTMYYFVRIEYIGSAIYPFLIMLFSRTYTDEKKFASKQLLLVILLINIITFIFVNTNSHHLLYYSSMDIDLSMGFSVLNLEKASWYYVQITSLYFALIYSIAVFAFTLKKSKGNYRKRVLCMFIGTIIPLITLSLYVFNLVPVHLDLTPFSYLFMSLFIVFGLFKFDTLFLMPITADMVFNSIDQAVLVIDEDGVLITFNKPSKVFFPSLSKIKVGESIDLISEFKDGVFDCNHRILEINNKIYQFKLIEMENKKVTIYVITDITESELAKKQLEILAAKDALTGLNNRRCFMRNIDESTGDGVFAIIDLDNFKKINDTYGHDEGDNVLRFFGNNFKEFFNDEKVCRYGGEEFALFIENPDVKQAFEKIEAFREKIDVSKSKVKFTFSAGLARYKKGNISEAISQADKKLYEAKANGRNQSRY